MLIKLLQPSKANSPMLVKPSGIDIIFRDEQFWNAQFPTLVKVLGNLTRIKLVHDVNALSGMLVAPSDIITVVRLGQDESLVISPKNKTNFSELHSFALAS